MMPKGWREITLGDVLVEHKEKTTSNKQYEVMTSSRQGLILQSEYYDGDNRITNRDNTGFNVIPPGYFTYRSRSDDGSFFFNRNRLRKTGCISTYYPVFKFQESSDEFFFYLLNRNNKIYEPYSVGTSQKVLSLSALKEIKFVVPPISEQEKIAKILSTWDEAIEKCDTTAHLTSVLKQYLLKRIIYENQVQKKEGWALKPVSELFDILDNRRKPLNSTQRQAMTGGVPYYGANGQVGTVDDFIFDEPLILLAEDGGYFDEYSTRPIAYRIAGKSWVNNHAHVLKAKAKFNFDFLYFALVHKNIMPFLNGGTRAKLNKAVLEEIEIPIPKKLSEQEAIADLFNFLEQKEKFLKKRITLFQKQKQGLMQQLLTGKKRVKV